MRREKSLVDRELAHFWLCFTRIPADPQYDATRRPNGEYELKVPYDTDEELDEAVNDLLTDIACGADDRHCFSESHARMEGTDRHW